MRSKSLSSDQTRAPDVFRQNSDDEIAEAECVPAPGRSLGPRVERSPGVVSRLKDWQRAEAFGKLFPCGARNPHQQFAPHRDGQYRLRRRPAAVAGCPRRCCVDRARPISTPRYRRQSRARLAPAAHLVEIEPDVYGAEHSFQVVDSLPPDHFLQARKTTVSVLEVRPVASRAASTKLSGRINVVRIQSMMNHMLLILSTHMPISV